jgi:hypothetical protein
VSGFIAGAYADRSTIGAMRKLFAIAMVLVLATACGSVNDAKVDAPPGDGTRDDGMQPTGVVSAAAPTVQTPMYQGSQREFRTQAGGTCKGRTAASMGVAGFCYLAADDNVKCAGIVGSVNYGLVPSNTGQTGAEQIMVFFLDNGMCVTRTDHTVQCMGTNTNAFGNTITTTFGRWTARNDIAAITTGTWDNICGITLAGQVYCGGLPSFGNPPVTVGTPGQTSLWVDTGGDPHLSDPAVLRPGESRTECTVRSNGLICGGTAYGPTNGTIVNGSRSSSGGGGGGDFYCWLDSAGTVGCTTGPRFAAGKVVYLAASYYSDSQCAIYNDGSIWCIGSNPNGKFGTGNTAPLATETMVAPPGSARVRCD